MRRPVPVTLIFVAMMLASAVETRAADGDWIVVFHEGSVRTSLAAADRDHSIKRQFHIIPGFVASMSEEGAEAWRRNPEVAYVERDGIVRLASRVGGTRVASGDQVVPWGIDRVRAPEAWMVTKGSGVRIAVLDTGLDFNNPDLPVPVGSVSFVADPVQDSTYGHGTHVSGIALALDNAIGVVGVAPESDLMVVRVFDAFGSGTFSGIVSGIEWAVDNGADVINMSFATPTFSQSMEDAVNAAVASGVVAIAAAGNNNTSTPFYPAATPAAVSVMMTNDLDQKVDFGAYGSNHGPTIDIGAPGLLILSTVPVGSFITASAEWDSMTRYANVMTGSAIGSVTAPVFDCGLADGSSAANTCPAAVNGNIALIRIGNNSVGAKVAHAESMGAIGAIIANNIPGNFFGSVGGSTSLVAIGVSQEDGDDLVLLGDGTLATASVTAADYGINNGTSMAAPHVAGAAALLCHCYGTGRSPERQAAVRSALEASAVDLGDAGRDDTFGYGLLDAFNALETLGRCGIDLDLDIVSSSAEVMAGSGPSNLVHTLTLRNVGVFGATDVVIDIGLSGVPGVTAVVIPSAGVFADSTWTIAGLAAGESATLTVQYSVDATAPAWSDLETTTSVGSAGQSDLNAANDSDTVSSLILPQTTGIPTADHWALALLGLMLAIAGGVLLRR